MPKLIPKVIPKSTFGRSGVQLLRFGEVFGGLDLFMSFVMCKKLTRNQTKWKKFEAIGVQGDPAGDFWAGRRKRRSSWEPSFGSFGEEISKNVRHAEHHRLKTGSADIEAKASCRRPEKIKKMKK